MQNRVTVNVAGHNYVLLAQEGEEYVHQVADFVNDQLRQTLEGGEMTQVDCALLTCLNIADQHLKEKEAGENLRRQIKDLLEENAQLKMELHQSKHPRQEKTTKK
ncbi:cell division protein ZapA [Pseudoflavonifractor capillosus]|uniref:cell division protein ZapA n=1 Tax=Pseudoflavonifractor capillosus TaxID=106588 RepID=UPI00195E8495|nr:cell division protein ZapA [Pseudoflavonifractor capillosus]MBM6897640.1 cell division protein ZapA [Pseudoflavonifractor capillosus]